MDIEPVLTVDVSFSQTFLTRNTVRLSVLVKSTNKDILETGQDKMPVKNQEELQLTHIGELQNLMLGKNAGEEQRK
jgi:hypothetical protein